MSHFENIGYEESVRITLTFDQDEYAIIKNIAKNNDQTVSSFIKDLVIDGIFSFDAYEKKVADCLYDQAEDLTEEELKVAKIIFYVLRKVEQAQE